MKIKFIPQDDQEEVVVTITASPSSVEANKIIEYLYSLNQDNFIIVDDGNEKIKIFYEEIHFFFTDGYIVYVKINDEKYRTKYRIYELEKVLPDEIFVKINQGVIANITKIKKVSPCINGTMRIDFLNGDTEYASRRSVRKIKEKLGI